MSAWNNFVSASAHWFGLVPSVDATPEDRLAWDQTVALGGFVFLVFGVLHVFAACGWLYWMGIQGFATYGQLLEVHEDIEEVAVSVEEGVHDVKQIRLESLQRDIADNRRRQCIAIAAGDPSLPYAEIIRGARATHDALANIPYDVRPCIEYVVMPRTGLTTPGSGQ